MNTLLSRYRVVLYLALNGFFALTLSIASMSQGGPLGTLVYVILMFALCSASLFWLDRLNGRYAVLAIFLAIYFMFFGVLDAISLASGTALGGDFLSEAEMALLCGAAAALIGYRCGVALAGSSSPGRQIADWSVRMTLVVGIAFWLAGTVAITYFQVFALPEKTNAAAAHGFAMLGPVWTFAVMLGGMIQPMGLVIIAYGYARHRTFGWLALTLTMVVVQVAVGFITDIKSVAMLAGILVILARVMVDGRLPKAWLLGGAVFIAFAFPLFQAYRSDVSGERGMNHIQALENIDKVIDIVLADRDRVTEKPAGYRSQTFFERASLKGNVELAFLHTGVDTPFREGETLVELWVAFIPRLIWPDKPDVPVGQLFNHEFFHGDENTYISPSHFGELYWNFGWPGVLLGMTFIGAMLGFIATRCNLADHISVTRVLVLLATIKYVCLGFEGSIAIAYVTWLRSLAAVGLLHLLLARRRYEVVPTARPISDNGPVLAGRVPQFPNLLR